MWYNITKGVNEMKNNNERQQFLYGWGNSSNHPDLCNIVIRAIDSFNNDQNEHYLIDNTLSERCICSRFASHITNELIEPKYSGYVVDVEYNRNGQDIKRIDDTSGPITVDLIVHKHGKILNTI